MVAGERSKNIAVGLNISSYLSSLLEQYGAGEKICHARNAAYANSWSDDGNTFLDSERIPAVIAAIERAVKGEGFYRVVNKWNYEYILYEEIVNRKVNRLYLPKIYITDYYKEKDGNGYYRLKGVPVRPGVFSYKLNGQKPSDWIRAHKLKII